MNSDTTQEVQGRLTPRRADLAAALACLPDLVVAVILLAECARWGRLIEAHALVLHDIEVSGIVRNRGATCAASTIVEFGDNVHLAAGLGPILTMWWCCG